MQILLFDWSTNCVDNNSFLLCSKRFLFEIKSRPNSIVSKCGKFRGYGSSIVAPSGENLPQKKLFSSKSIGLLLSPMLTRKVDPLKDVPTGFQAS